MKEVTMIITCEITTVEVVTDKEAAFLENNMEAVESEITKSLKEDTASDDVVILKNQLFIRDHTETVEM